LEVGFRCVISLSAGIMHTLTGGYDGVGSNNFLSSSRRKVVKSWWHSGHAVLGIDVVIGWFWVCGV